jgi:hypothetical protein
MMSFKRLLGREDGMERTVQTLLTIRRRRSVSFTLWGSQDEYDSWGSGKYFTDDVYMCDRFTYSEAQERAAENGLKLFHVAIAKNKEEYKITIVKMQ